MLHQKNLQLDKFPLEILVMLAATNLNLTDTANLQFVSKQFNSITHNPTIWQNFIKKYFPYLEEKNPDAFQKDPKSLFCGQYLGYMNIFEMYKANTSNKNQIITHAEFQNALSGNLDDILKMDQNIKTEDTDSGMSKRTYLLQQALYNGHVQVIPELQKSDPNSLNNLLLTLLTNQSKSILEKVTQHIDFKDKLQDTIYSIAFLHSMAIMAQKSDPDISTEFLATFDAQIKLLIETFKEHLTEENFAPDDGHLPQFTLNSYKEMFKNQTQAKNKP